MDSIQPIKGFVQYFFKGIKMRAEAGIGLIKGNTLIVSFDKVTDIESVFVKIEEQWLLQSHTNSSSLLYGTEFIPLKTYE